MRNPTTPAATYLKRLVTTILSGGKPTLADTIAGRAQAPSLPRSPTLWQNRRDTCVTQRDVDRFVSGIKPGHSVEIDDDSLLDTQEVRSSSLLGPTTENPLILAESSVTTGVFSFLDHRPGGRVSPCLMDQLEFEGFTSAEATLAVDYLDVDWNQQAVFSAESYLDLAAFFRIGPDRSGGV